MGTIKIRLIDTDVILNLILMQKRSNIHLGLGSPNELNKRPEAKKYIQTYG